MYDYKDVCNILKRINDLYELAIISEVVCDNEKNYTDNQFNSLADKIRSRESMIISANETLKK